MDLTGFKPYWLKQRASADEIVVEKAIISAAISQELQGKMLHLKPILTMAKEALIARGWSAEEAAERVKQMAGDMINRNALICENLSKPISWRGVTFLREHRLEILARGRTGERHVESENETPYRESLF